MEAVKIMYLEKNKYDMAKIIPNFAGYFGMTFEEVTHLITDYKLISKEDLIAYIYENSNKMQEVIKGYPTSLEDIVKTRLFDYEYYQKLLSIYSEKGTYYLILLKYLSSQSVTTVTVNEYEEFFKNSGIIHHNSIIHGRDLSRLLAVLSNIILEMQKILIKVNNLETYNNPNISQHSFMHEYDYYYPTKKLILDDSDYTSYDKTSLSKVSPSQKYSYIKVKKLTP